VESFSLLVRILIGLDRLLIKLRLRKKLMIPFKVLTLFSVHSVEFRHDQLQSSLELSIVSFELLNVVKIFVVDCGRVLKVHLVLC